MKTLSTKVTTAIAGPVLSPAYLVEILFTTPIRSCTRGSVLWNGITWPAAALQVGELTTGQAGSKSIVLTMANNAFAISQIVLAETAAGRRARVWKLFGESPYALEDAHLIFDGYIDAIPSMVDVVEMHCSTGLVRTLSIPNLTVGLPFFNHVPRPGQVVAWGNDQYELQPR